MRRLISCITFFGTALFAIASCDDPGPSGMKVTVQKWNGTGQCYATLPGSDKLDPVLPVESCVNDANDPLIAGADRLRLIVDYGDLQFAVSPGPPKPTVTSVLDGVSSANNASTTSLTSGDRTSFAANFMVPAQLADQLSIFVDAAPGFGRGPLGPYRVSAPDITILPQGCPISSTCETVGGVGSLPLSISYPATTKKVGTLTWTLNGIPQRESDSFSLDIVEKGIAIGTAYPLVPATAEGTKWVLTARIGDSSSSTPDILIHAPQIESRLDGCTSMGSTCGVTPGQAVALVITAPRLIQAKQASVSTTVGGLPDVTAAKVDLATTDLIKDTASGVLPLKAPVQATSGSSWLIDVNVNGYSSSTLVVPFMTTT
jgi:hypothetical protein